MIIRKPYAFLIKNFKKIHLLLLLISMFVAYKLFSVSRFVNDFMLFGTYDFYANPITNYITWYVSLLLLVMSGLSVALIILLKYKKKPWKVYLIPFLEYLTLFFVLNMIKGFFNHFTNDIQTTDLRLSRDLLMIFMMGQVPAIFVFFMRVTGMDMKKFNFNSDAEFLELSEADREEFEISLDIDKNSFIRFYKKSKRNLGYFYLEHKAICNIIFGIIGVIIIYNFGHFLFVTNRSYKEGQKYYANGYNIVVKGSYYTNKNFKGEQISKKSNFVVVDLAITNVTGDKRTINVDNFHIKNGISDYISDGKSYEKDFQDYGNTNNRVRKIKIGETIRLILVYKVDKNLQKNRFVLCYQELDTNNILRKIKLKIKDVSEVKDYKTLKMNEDMEFTLKGNDQFLSLDEYEISKDIYYYINHCNTLICENEIQYYTAPEEFTVLKIVFSSSDFEGKDMIDFSNDYGKIVFIDNDNNERIVEFRKLFSKNTTGKIAYALVPEEIATSESIKIVYTIRNKIYTYVLK